MVAGREVRYSRLGDAMKRLALVLVVALFSSVATAGPPEFSGVVMRGTTGIGFVFVDWNAGLVVTLGTDPPDFCSGSGDIDFVAWQDMNMPNGSRWVTINKGSDIRAYVYELSEFDPYDTVCDGVLNGVLPLATGHVTYRYRDNDYAAMQNCESKENFNSFGWSFEGPLYSFIDGRKRQFSGHSRVVWDCDTGRVVHDDTKFSLTR